jgi:hypothetical protein
VDGFGFRAVILKEAGSLIGLTGFQRHHDGTGMWDTPQTAYSIGFMPRLGFRIEPNCNPDDAAGSGAPSVLGILERTPDRA